MLRMTDLDELEKHLSSGEFEDHFKHSAEDRRFEMLEFLEKLMELSELADAVATRIIFKSGSLASLTGAKKTSADTQ